MRRIHIKRIDPDPMAVVHEEDVVEVDDGKMAVAVVRNLRLHQADYLKCVVDGLRERHDCPVLAIGLGEGQDFELREEE